MQPNQHSAEQIIKILEQAEKGEQSVAAVCRKHSIAKNTFYRWCKPYHGMSTNEAQRLIAVDVAMITSVYRVDWRADRTDYTA